MTLIEIMIVVGIIAMIAGGVAVALLPNLEKARIKSTKADAQGMRAAVILYKTDSSGCPSVNDLISGKYLDSNKRTKDAWDTDFQINCDGGDVVVVSAGPDQQFGTDDDVK